MPGRWNDEQIRCQEHRLLAIQQVFDAAAQVAGIGAVQNTCRAKAPRPGIVVRHVIAMSEKHPANASHLLNSRSQRIIEPGRINKDVPIRTLDQVTGSTEGRFGGKAAKIYVLINVLRKRRDCVRDGLAVESSDRCRRASDQRFESGEFLGFGTWLAVHNGLLAFGTETLRSYLTAQIAIDATAVDKKTAGYVLRTPEFGKRHKKSIRFCLIKRQIHERHQEPTPHPATYIEG